jgi:hypothetical protein
VLHLTNGDCAIPALRAAGVDGEILAWTEVLHDGPIPGGLGVEDLRQVRAVFLGDEEPLRKRDERLAAAVRDREPLMLWFESDLYDVLLILQIVDRLPEDHPARLVLVGEDRWTSVTEVDPEELGKLRADAPELNAAQRAAARSGWMAFTSDSPYALERLAYRGTPSLPAVAQTASRLLQELPWTGSGLSRTERQLLEPLANGARSREEAFHAAIAAEERPFLGDTSAWAALDRLAPLLDGTTVNERGRAVLAGEVRWEPEAERWLGGTRIPPGRSPWEWDPEATRVRRV